MPEFHRGGGIVLRAVYAALNSGPVPRTRGDVHAARVCSHVCPGVSLVCFSLAAVNGVVEIRGDLVRILYTWTLSPSPKPRKNIGVWYFFLELFAVVGCFTNFGIATIAVRT